MKVDLTPGSARRRGRHPRLAEPLGRRHPRRPEDRAAASATSVPHARAPPLAVHNTGKNGAPSFRKESDRHAREMTTPSHNARQHTRRHFVCRYYNSTMRGTVIRKISSSTEHSHGALRYLRFLKARTITSTAAWWALRARAWRCPFSSSSSTSSSSSAWPSCTTRAGKRGVAIGSSQWARVRERRGGGRETCFLASLFLAAAAGSHSDSHIALMASGVSRYAL